MTAALAEAIAAAAGGTLRGWRAVPGGDINAALRVDLTDGRRLFAKHRADPPDGFYAAEAAGLCWLADAGALPTPPVVAATDAFLALEWIDPAPRAPDFDARLGEGLARLHRAGAARPGATADDGPTFLGPLRLPNAPAAPDRDAVPDAADTGAAPADRDVLPDAAAAPDVGAASGARDGFEPDDWATFYARRRLAPLLRMAVDAGAVDRGTAQSVQAVIDGIDALVGPPEPPARLHGDLWSGNVMAGPDGGPVLVDPAAYGGHREVDLAMLELFGRPGPDFAAAYDAAYPRADGHRERVALYQLLPLLVHAVLFGGGYGASVDAAARRALS